ncbi:MAG: exodeoxyribonuclease V subunit gamma [Chlorobiaceae bacterium]|nr:exodeoxyribonuclease V subunit gamma [Chlorobiaceae bacterium]
MPLNLFTSNRMEVLVDALGSTLSEPATSVLSREMIVVQSRGMQRWLSMELASRFGVWANGHYPFPNSMVIELFASLFPSLSNSSAFVPEVMAWKIMQLLPALLESAPFDSLQHYLSDDCDGIKLFQLSEKIADTFDQYTLFRSDLLAEWESGKSDIVGDEWQAILWRRLNSEIPGVHRGQMKEQFCMKLSHSLRKEFDLPERISLFGISYLPKYHLDILSSVARLTEVNLFLLSPTYQYWSDILPKKRVMRLSLPERKLRSEGNPLLASLGTTGRDFFDMILDLSDGAYIQEEMYDDPGHDSLLHSLQSDMLHLSGTGDEADETARTLDPLDRSVRIHSCHSPLREIEVLHDNILEMLSGDSTLTAGDIVVMTPDIEIYSPYIASVFSEVVNGAAHLPFSIADRRIVNEGEIAHAVLKVLSLYGSRLAASELFDLLSSPPVMRRFEIDDEALGIIRNWIEKTRIRWGMDEHDRERRALPSYRENSWREGLKRLLLGYAMADEEQLFNGTLPFGDVTASSSDTLGRFAEFVDAVEAFVQSLDRLRDLEGWRRWFQELLAAFISPDESSEREYASIAALGETISDISGGAAYDGEVSASVMLSWFKARLEQQEQGLGFMTGGITFCAMLPMRSIPFKVVVLVGMNDSAFPRQNRPPGFDLIATSPRRGDRSLRNEDRYLFLESLLSAREIFYISYVGQSIRDNSEKPPSVLVSELLDAVHRGFRLSSGAPLTDHIVVRHRLQAFNPEYFTAGSGLFSYSTDNYNALIEKQHPLSTLRPFMSEQLEEPSEECKSVPLEQLLRFYDNPSRFFLEQRLAIRIEESARPLEDREPFTLEGLERYQLQQELLKIILQGEAPEEQLPLFRSRGMLPPALHGERLFFELLGEVKAFAAQVQEQSGGRERLAPLDVDLQLGGFRLTGRLERVWPEHQLHYRCAKRRPKDTIRSWIEHLVLNAEARIGYPAGTLLLMVDGLTRFSPVDDAAVHLEHLLNHYWQGLLTPLRFFPHSSLAYASKSEEPEKLKAARVAWMDNDFTSIPGEGSDPAILRCFGVGDPFDAEFRALSDELLSPMIRAGGNAE